MCRQFANLTAAIETQINRNPNPKYGIGTFYYSQLPQPEGSSLAAAWQQAIADTYLLLSDTRYTPVPGHLGWAPKPFLRSMRRPSPEGEGLNRFRPSKAAFLGLGFGLCYKYSSTPAQSPSAP